MKHPNTGNLATDYHIVCEWLKEKEAEIDRLKAERKEFCPNCEAETPCTHEAELFVCDICGEDFAKYIVPRKCNVSDVSMTRDVLTDIKTPPFIENNNPDYYKDELYLDEDFRMLAKTYPADVSAIGVTALIDYVEALEAELARLQEKLHDEMGQLEIATDLGNKRWLALNDIYENGEKHNSNWCKRKAQEGLGIR